MKRKTFQELNLIDNFLFEEAMNQEENGIEFCRILLSTILQRDFKNIKITPQWNVPGIRPDQHGIRMDAYIEAEEVPEGDDFSVECMETGKHLEENVVLAENAEVEIKSSIYDIEPNTYETKSEARRTRYYHSLIDARILKSGIDYDKLKDVVVIMILPYDPFGKNRMMYTFRTSCVEDTSIPYDDGVTTIFLYTEGEEGIPSQELKDMLRYIQNTTTENATNDNLKNLQHMVNQIKKDGEAGVRYMKSWEYEELARREGREAGLKEGRNAGLREGKVLAYVEMGLSVEEIAKKTGLAEEEILVLKNKNC